MRFVFARLEGLDFSSAPSSRLCGATNKIDDVLTEHIGLLHVLPLAVHPEFFLLDKWGGPL